MLTLEHVTAGYGETVVLRDVDLCVPAGDVRALLGPNGAGKTTLLRTASGLLGPSSGRVLLHDKDVTTDRPHTRAADGLCHVPEGRGIFGPLTVRENIILFSPKGREKESVEHALEFFPLLRRCVGQPAGTLSGGQQQMVALARALVSDAPLVLLDEVSMGLAPIIVDDLYDFIRKLAGMGRAILLVEQYVNKALAVADYVYILSRGRVAFAGNADGLDGDDVFRHYMGIEVA